VRSYLVAGRGSQQAAVLRTAAHNHMCGDAEHLTACIHLLGSVSLGLAFVCARITDTCLQTHIQLLQD
jgi:hypothetical protein